MIVLYTKIQENQQQVLLQNHLGIFSKEHQQKLLRYRRWQDVQLSLLGKLLIKEGMAYFDKEVDFKELSFTKYKKPYFENMNETFNISHSGELVIAIISESQQTHIGIDIEKIHSVCIEDFKGQMTAYEQETIFSASDQQKAFFKYWTQKEAVLKAHGKGLSIPLKSFEIKNNQTYVDDTTFFLSEMEVKEGYVCHVAMQQKITTEKLIIKEIHINRFMTP